MSKSIRELMVEAGMQFRLDSTSAQIENGIASFEELYVYDKFDPLKYAELIVRECVYVSEGYFGFKDHTPGTAIAKEMKEHFGVE